MRENFDKSWAFTMKWEGGGKVHTVAGDPGGTTKWGIAQRWHKGIDVANLTEGEAKKIARKEYWDPAMCDAREWPLDLLAFDTAFNLGLDDVQSIDKATMQSNSRQDWEAFLLRRVMKHIQVAQKLPPKIRANRWGWLFRCADLYRECLGGFF